MIGMVADVELFSNDRQDGLGGPDFPDEAEGFGTPGEQTGKLCELLGGQPGRGAGWRPGVQRFGASFAPPLQPPAGRALGDAQSLGDGCTRPALLMKCPRPQSAPLAPVPRRAWLGYAHGAGEP
jgi:hypothetical protein